MGRRVVAEALVLAATRIETVDSQLCELVAHYWRLVPDEKLVGQTAEEMLLATVSHRELATQRRPGEIKLRVGESLNSRHTVFEVVTDNMPFVVDSVTGAVLAGGLDICQLVHPLVVVRREVRGALREIRLDLEPQDARTGDIVEIWMRVETDRVPDARALEKVRRSVARVLNDVLDAAT